MPAPRCDEYGTTHALAILRKGAILGNASVANDARNGPEAPVHDNACRGRNLEHAGLIRTFKPRSRVRCTVFSASCSIETPALTRRMRALLGSSLLKGMSGEEA